MNNTKHNFDSEAKFSEYMEKYTEMIIEECRKALHPELRDMISRGKAFELIKEHFGIK